ncbi:hypothetical protein EFW17_14060 [Halostreptopolyspora alba]|uniref:Uncharacterized protein n=1 Tax=Halostreptopolyspora alba TaxID=2487137 RepID=A0A3N0E8E4_9ACTN|nr:hypothetical protein EFW17_14060 [Nocardiopsaceae bacterium YIM 96095]
MGSAVASLIAAVLTMIASVAFWFLAAPVLAIIAPEVFWFLAAPVLSLLVSIPGIVLAGIALSKPNDPPELERFMRYAWACTIVYTGLMAVIVVAVLLLVSALLSS